MGVIDRKDLAKPSEESNQVSPSEDELSIPEEQSDVELRLVRVRRPRHNPVQLHAPLRPSKHCGKRRLRHFRAVEDLRNLLHDSDEVIEITIHDFMHLRPSPFALLLQDDTLLKAWWEFINKPEEENKEVVCKKGEIVMHDSKVGSPTIPPEYKKIEQSLKELLHRKSLDITMIEAIEQQLVEFFVTTPKDVLKLKKLTRYESMINQATCQYHGLMSQCEQECKKRNALFVTLIGDEYIQPATALHNYLRERQQFYSLA